MERENQRKLSSDNNATYAESLPDKTEDADNGTCIGESEECGEKADEIPAHPVDKGWAWVILIAAIFEIFIYGGLMRSYGLFFIQFQQRFGSSASQTTLIQTVFNICSSLSGILVMTVGMKYMTARTSICIGAVINSAAYIIAAYTRHIEVLILVLGGVTGLTATMIYLPILSFIGIYFNKRRGLANSLAVAGSSFGALVLGPLFTTSFEHYGYSGTMLLTAGFLLNILITGCLFRDPKFYANHKIKAQVPRLSNRSNDVELRTQVDGCSVLSETKSSTGNDIFMAGSHKDIDIDIASKDTDDYVAGRSVLAKKLPLLYRSLSESDSPGDKQTAHIRQYVPLLARHTSQTNSSDHHDIDSLKHRVHSTNNIHSKPDIESRIFHKSHELCTSIMTLASSTDVFHGSLIALNTAANTHTDTSIGKQPESLNKTANDKCCVLITTKTWEFLSTVFDKNLMKDPVFIHFMFLSIVSAPSASLTSMYFIPLAKDTGIATDKLSMLLFVNGAVDLVSKISTGVLVDRKVVRPTTVIWAAFVIAGVVNNLTRLIHGFGTMVIFVIVQDLGIATDKLSMLLFVNGAVDLVSKISTGVLVDRKVVRPTTVIWAAFVVAGVVNNLTRLIHGFGTMVVFVIVQASLSGVYLTLFAVILVENLGIDKFKGALGFTFMFHGGSTAAAFPVTGYLRDVTGAYHSVYHLLSALLLIGAGLAFTLPLTHRRSHRETSKTTER